MTQANLPSPDLSLMKNRKGTGAATKKSGTQVHMMGAGGRTGDISNTDRHIIWSGRLGGLETLARPTGRRRGAGKGFSE